jgi:hypothetical protein
MTNASGVADTHSGISPFDAFTGVIVPARAGFLYNAGLAIVAFAMVLLPAIYIALIGLTALGVYYHLTHDAWLLGVRSGWIYWVILYLGPVVVGSILVFFMVKPFFAHPQKEAETLSLDPAKEPVLFRFVEKICQLVQAPIPSRIDVDCQVNASARLRHGLWSKDLVLTIGMPLAAGLDMRQFGGVLAHEFGHFTQGAGMRLTYLIRKINLWFARVVYERDSWDLKLDESARTADFRIKIVLQTARGSVWLTRRILWALMHAGHAISCFMLRQMEYDADSYEAKLAGSDTFESTIERLPVLSVAMQFALEDLRRSWVSSRLAEDLPLLIDHKATSLPAEVHQQLAAARASTKTGWFQTHPCDTDRIRAARRLNEPGIFRMTQPAARLFADFNALSRTVTRHQYEKHFGLEFAEENLIPAEEILRESTASAETEAVVRKFYGRVNVCLKPLLVESDWSPLADPQSAIAEWREKRKASDQLREQAERISAAWAEEQSRLVDATAVLCLAKARFSVTPKEFGLPEAATTIPSQEIAARSLADKTRATTALQLATLDPFVTALRQRVTLALRFAMTTARETSPETASEIETPGSLLVAVGAEMPGVYEIGAKLRACSLLAQNRANHPDPAHLDKVASEIALEMQTLLGLIQERLKDWFYPFPHPRGQLGVAEYLAPEKLMGKEWQRSYVEIDASVDRLFTLHYRLLGKLLAHADAAEKALETQATAPA